MAQGGRYNPRHNTNFAAIVREVDPNHDAKKRKEREYEFSNKRVFRANPAQRGAYADD